MFDPFDEDSPWSAEGLACYTTYRIVKEFYGEQTARKEYVERWQEEVDSYYKDFYVRHPEYLSALPEEYQADIANSLRGVRQYSEMPLKILKAEELVGGEEAMDEILSGLFGLGLGWVLGRRHPVLIYAVMGVTLLLCWLPLPQELAFSMGGFFCPVSAGAGRFGPGVFRARRPGGRQMPVACRRGGAALISAVPTAKECEKLLIRKAETTLFKGGFRLTCLPCVNRPAPKGFPAPMCCPRAGHRPRPGTDSTAPRAPGSGNPW